MRIATWNVNSLRSRIDRVEAFVQRHDIDVLALQETKAREDQLPLMGLQALGYDVAVAGVWDDLNPSTGSGRTYWIEYSDAVGFYWRNVRESGVATANTRRPTALGASVSGAPRAIALPTPRSSTGACETCTHSCAT